MAKSKSESSEPKFFILSDGSRLCVNGVEGLRVADCSVIPGHVTGNTNAPAMAIGLRAAAMMLEDSP